MKKHSLVPIFILSVFLLFGCYDNKEIDETAYIIALGIDKGSEGGYDYTFQFSAPLATINGEGSPEASEETPQNPTVRNLTISAPDFYTAKNMTNNFLSKTVDMSHLKLIVFSAGVDSDGFLNHSQFLLREREVRPHTAVALAKTSARDYLKSVNPHLEANTAKYYELMSLRSNNVFSPTKRLSDFVDELHSSGVSLLPVAFSGQESEADFEVQNSALKGTENSKIITKSAELRGMAIFKDGKVQSMMSGKDAMLFNILTRSIKSCTITLENPHLAGSFLTFRLNIPHPARYSFAPKETPLSILISQNFEISFFGTRPPEGFSEDAEVYDYAKKVLTDEFLEYFYKLSKSARADIMKIEAQAKKSFLTEKEWNEYEWEKAFQRADFKINIGFE